MPENKAWSFEDDNRCLIDAMAVHFSLRLVAIWDSIHPKPAVLVILVLTWPRSCCTCNVVKYSNRATLAVKDCEQDECEPGLSTRPYNTSSSRKEPVRATTTTTTKRKVGGEGGIHRTVV